MCNLGYRVYRVKYETGLPLVAVLLLVCVSDSEGPARVQAMVTLREVLEDRQWLEQQSFFLL